MKNPKELVPSYRVTNEVETGENRCYTFYFDEVIEDGQELKIWFCKGDKNKY